MTWELLAYIVNGIAVISCFAFIGGCIYVYFDNCRTKRKTTNKFPKGSRMGAGLRDSKGDKDEV